MAYTIRSHIRTLPKDVQRGIRKAIKRQVGSDHMTELAMDSRLSDLEGLIDARYWLRKANGTGKSRTNEFGLVRL